MFGIVGFLLIGLATIGLGYLIWNSWFRVGATNKSNYKSKIGSEYDDWNVVLEHFFGEHIHHGYYGESGLEPIHYSKAQERLIEELLKWGEANSQNFPPVKEVLDVGCGVGGSSRYLARKFSCNVKGITLSSAQVERGKEIAASKGLKDKVTAQVADALETPFDSNSFDLIWSCESAEHMIDKRKLVEECLRQLKPGGLLLIATWCHRDSPQLNHEERSFLRRLYDIWALPFFISIEDYTQILRELERSESNHFKFKVADWTKPVHNFWWDIIKTRATIKDSIWLLSCGPRMVLRTIRDLYGSYLMHEGFRRGIVTYGVIAVRKDKK